MTWTVGACSHKGCPMTLVAYIGGGQALCWLHCLQIGPGIVQALHTPAHLHLDGWEGRTKQAVVIVGESARSYRITPAGDERVKLGGRSRWLAPGETTLVPKRAVTVGDPDV